MQQSNPPSRAMLIVTALAIMGGAIAYLFFKSSQNLTSAPESNSQVVVEPSAPEASATQSDDSEPRALTASEQSKVPKLPPVVQPATRSAAPGTTGKVQPSAYTRQLVCGLTNLDFSHGPITKAQADQWRQSLQSLTSQGAAAVPAIREFLEQNQEMNFTSMTGGELLGQPSLRSALINALAQIGGPEATSVMVQTLQSTTLPSEIAQLAGYLEQQGPGQYRQEIMNAVNEVLGMAGKGQLPGWDVGTLFKVLQNYGDPSTAGSLEQLQGQWKYYATMALAGMQNGEGVPVLVQEVQDASAGGKRDLAFQMLAQVAAQYPDAATALLEQAKANQISDTTWRKIAMGLAGDQYQIGAAPSDAAANGAVIPGLKTYHIESGNQNFYSLPVAGDAQIQQRIALIDQLLAATSNPTAISALQGAKATLTAMGVK